MSMETKYCPKCRKELPTSEFNKHKNRKDGLQSCCRECQKQYKQSEKGKETQRKYQHSEKGKDTRRKYRQSEKGKEVNRRAWRKYEQSEKGKECRRKYQQGKSIPTMWIDGKPKKISRYLMEQHIRRELLPTEIVHHIDGNPFNNNIKNLQLCKNQLKHMKIHKEMR